MAKTQQPVRKDQAARILAWCDERGVTPDRALVGQINDGFGSGKDGEDRFDAVVGLLGMLETVTAHDTPPVPDDRTLRDVEGWMFGRTA